MDERSRRVRLALGTLLLPAAFLLAGTFSIPEAQAQSMAEASRGQKIFFKVCVQCHTMQDKDQASGPGLEGIMDRIPSEKWLLEWLKNPKALVEAGDSYAQSIVDDYPLDMPKLEVMQKESNRKAILTFFKQFRANPME